MLFLAAVTIAVLLVRSGLDAGSSPTPAVTGTTAAAVTTQTVTLHRKRPKHQSAAGYYTVQTGDTFNSISAKTGVSVAQLARLNPGVSTNSLQIGQRLRVK